MIIVGSKVTFIVPSADAKCDYADGEILDISYKDKSGNVLFPGEFLVKKDIAKTYPIQELKSSPAGSLKLYIIPINDLIKWRQ